jgi:hypothetical protein
MQPYGQLIGSLCESSRVQEPLELLCLINRDSKYSEWCGSVMNNVMLLVENEAWVHVDGRMLIILVSLEKIHGHL